MAKEITVAVHLTERELWELSNNFGQSFESGGEGNEIADKVADKLADAAKKFKFVKRNT
jgi:hypothetical protein